MYSSSRQDRWDAWSEANVLSISLASPPSAIMINDRATPLKLLKDLYPVITVHGETYHATDGTYSLSGGQNLYRDTTIAPGENVVLTWNWNHMSRMSLGEDSHLNDYKACKTPLSVVETECAAAPVQCYMAADSFDLLYFAPPSSTRDLCAATPVRHSNRKSHIQPIPYQPPLTHPMLRLVHS